MLTVVTSAKGVVGLYVDNKLVCTHDKFSRAEEIERSISRLSEQGVRDVFLDVKRTLDLPEELPVELQEKTEQKPEQKKSKNQTK